MPARYHRWLALLVLLAVLIVANIPPGLPSEAAPATPSLAGMGTAAQVPGPPAPGRSSRTPVAAPPQSPTAAGVVLMRDDPTSRSVRGGAAVGNVTYHGGPVMHGPVKVYTI